MFKSKKLNQEGFASLIIGLVLVTVMALITVGFAALTRHEQQQSLSKELSTQAYYAAESGINDITHLIKTNYASISGNSTVISNNNNQNNCLTTSDFASLGLSPTINAANGVQYTCAIVHLQTDTLDETGILPDTARTVVTDTSAGLTDLKINWNTADSQTGTAGSGFPYASASTWNAPGVVQLSVTPLDGTTEKRTDLINKTFTVYLYPSSGSNTVPYSAAASGQGKIVGGSCSNGYCSANISGLPGGTHYLVHMLMQYDKSDVHISGSSGGTAIKFSGGQAQIDVTGQARNVFKRLKVSIPIGQGNDLANYALEAQNICKRLELTDNNTQPVIIAPTPDYDTVNNDSCDILN